MFRKQDEPECEVEDFVLSDGDELECYWYNKKENPSKILILFHGLAGSFKSSYIQGMMNYFSNEGYTVVLMHFRGCGLKDNKMPRLYHSGETSDAKEFISNVKSRYPQSELYAVGFSLGGNMLLKLVAEQGEDSPFEAVVSVSAPLQLDLSSETMSKGFSKFYQWYLLKSLKKSAHKKFEKFDMAKYVNIKKYEINNLNTFWLFDDKITAPLHGFSDAKEYYDLSSSRQYLKDIRVNTLVINALDDPFMDENGIANKDEISSCVTLYNPKHGGHVGFVEGSFFKPNFFIERAVKSFFNRIDKSII